MLLVLTLCVAPIAHCSCQQGQYRAAHEVARGAEQLFQADLAAAQAASEAAWALKAGRLAAKQQAELEVRATECHTFLMSLPAGCY